MEQLKVINPDLPVITDIHHATLGRNAVQNAEDKAFCELTVGLGAIDDEFVSLDLGDARKTINKLDSYHNNYIDNYCDKSAPSAIKRAKDLNYSDQHWKYYLTWKASDEQLLNFLQWNAHNIKRLQNDPEVLSEVETQKTEFKNSIASATASGWLHEDSLNSVKKTDDIKVYIGDAFDTYFRDCGGYYTPGNNWVVIAGERTNANNSSSTVGQVRTALKHELCHATLGRFKLRWLNEAITEHIARSLSAGQESIVNPYDRRLDADIYTGEREILDLVLNGGKNKIPVKQATRAYSEQNSNDEKESFEKAINKSWDHVLPEGQSVVATIEAFIINHTYKFKSDGRRFAEAQKEAVAQALFELKYTPEQFFQDNKLGAKQESLA